MSHDKRHSSGLKSLSQFMGKWMYEPVQRYFSSGTSARAAERRSSSLEQSAVQTADNVVTGFSTVVLPDGAKLAYEVLGSCHLGKATPIVLICGMTALRGDCDKLPGTLAKSHPGISVELLTTMF